MGIIGFLCVSLGSSAVQVYDGLGSRRSCACSEASFSSQNGDLAWGLYYRITLFYCSFLWEKGLNAKEIHKEIFPVYCGKCLSRKAVHNWVEKRGNGFADDEEVETEVWKWLRQQSRDFLLQVSTHWQIDGTSLSVLVEDMSRNNVFWRFEYHMFYVLYPFVIYLLTVPRMNEWVCVRPSIIHRGIKRVIDWVSDWLMGWMVELLWGWLIDWMWVRTHESVLK
jgi:hypothetical protein